MVKVWEAHVLARRRSQELVEIGGCVLVHGQRGLVRREVSGFNTQISSPPADRTSRSLWAGSVPPSFAGSESRAISWQQLGSLVARSWQSADRSVSYT